MGKKTKEELLKTASDGGYIDNAPLDDDQIQEDGLPDDENEHTALWNDWQLTRDFLEMKNLPKCLRQYEDYYEGRQVKYMPKGLPKIQINVVRMIIDNKLSGILENPIQLSYLSNMDQDSTMELDRFSDYTLKNINFESLNRKVAKDSSIYGLGVAHGYWNEDAIGMDSIARGSMVWESIFPLNLGVANPYEKDIQKQEYIIIASRESVARAKLMADDGVRKELIVADDNEVRPTEAELDKGRLVTVLTRYFRKDGEVYFEKGTKNVMLTTEPVPLNPYLIYEKKRSMRLRDATTSHSPDEKLESFYPESKQKWSRYPVQLCVLSESADCYWGLSDVDDMVLGQNAINALYSLAIKNGIDLQAKYIVRPDALRGQTITNEIGQIIMNYSKHDDGIKQITGQASMSTEMLNLPLAISEMLRKVKNSSDVISGDISGKELSGNAIALLQTAAERPTEAQTRANQLFAIEMGKTFLLFYKFYYEQAQYAYNLNGMEKRELRNRYQLPEDMEIPNRIITKFNGSKYLDMSFDVQVEAGAGGRFSQINQLSFIQTFMQMAPNLDVNQRKFFINATPNYILKDKKEMLALLDEEENNENAQLKAKIEEQAQMIKILSNNSQYSAKVIKFYDQYIKNYTKETGNSLSMKDAELNELRSKASTPAVAPVSQIPTQANAQVAKNR